MPVPGPSSEKGVFRLRPSKGEGQGEPDTRECEEDSDVPEYGRFYLLRLLPKEMRGCWVRVGSMRRSSARRDAWYTLRIKAHDGYDPE